MPPAPLSREVRLPLGIGSLTSGTDATCHRSRAEPSNSVLGRFFFQLGTYFSNRDEYVDIRHMTPFKPKQCYWVPWLFNIRHFYTAKCRNAWHALQFHCLATPSVLPRWYNPPSSKRADHAGGKAGINWAFLAAQKSLYACI